MTVVNHDDRLVLWACLSFQDLYESNSEFATVMCCIFFVMISVTLHTRWISPTWFCMHAFTLVEEFLVRLHQSSIVVSSLAEPLQGNQPENREHRFVCSNSNVYWHNLTHAHASNPNQHAHTYNIQSASTLRGTVEKAMPYNSCNYRTGFNAKQKLLLSLKLLLLTCCDKLRSTVLEKREEFRTLTKYLNGGDASATGISSDVTGDKYPGGKNRRTEMTSTCQVNCHDNHSMTG